MRQCISKRFMHNCHQISTMRCVTNKIISVSAFTSDKQVVLLIDEIDKADIEFPNDLLQEIDRMEFYVYETKETIKAIKRPLVIITSNNEKELPDAFLRRCFFHYIKFPDQETLRKIVKVHYPDIKRNILNSSLKSFLNVSTFNTNHSN